MADAADAERTTAADAERMTAADAAEASEAAAGRGSRSTAVHRGGGAKGDITADFISFAKSKGLTQG